MILPHKVKEGLQTTRIGNIIHSFSEVTSTNDLAKELAAQGADEGTVLIAETQIHGKGRLGREWISPKGGIWLSIILRPRIHPREVSRLTLMSGIAVAKTIRNLLGLNATVKWPNDVLIGGKKVCGILTEARIKGNSIDFVVVGIGVNANIDVEAFPDHLRSCITSLRRELGKDIQREKFLRALLEELERRYEEFTQKGFHPILKEWRDLSSLLGKYVKVVSFDEEIKGRAIDIDQNGALIIQLSNGSVRKVSSGDVTIRK